MLALQPVKVERDRTHRKQLVQVQPAVAALVGLQAQLRRLRGRQRHRARVRHCAEQLLQVEMSDYGRA